MIISLPPAPPALVVNEKHHINKTQKRTLGCGTRNASWYGPGFQGNLTANGETYNQHGITAAHKTLPFGTRVQVVNQSNNLSVVVRINDRGPFIRGREIDLSKGAMAAIGGIDDGVVSTCMYIL